MGRERAYFIAGTALVGLVLGSLVVFDSTVQRTAHREFGYELVFSNATSLNITTGQEDFTAVIDLTRDERSVYARCALSLTYRPVYREQNLSLALESLYLLGDGLYSINENKSLLLVSGSPIGAWNRSTVMPGGVLVYGNTMRNTSYWYCSEPRMDVQILVLWEFNITSSIIPREDVSISLDFTADLVETSDGVPTGQLVTWILVMWAVTGIFILEWYRRTSRR